jgi:polysaccharide chain length determinant protein (PEP-CTERM system associated)
MFSTRQFTPRDYLLIVRRRKWLIVLPGIVLGVFAAVWSLTLPNIYRASTVILVEAQKVPETYVQATTTSPVGQRLATLSQQVMSRTRLEQIIKELRLMHDIREQKAVDEFLERMRSNIDFKVAGRDSFTISYADQDPYVVMNVTNKLASLFIEENLKTREQHAIGTTDFLAKELERVGRLLEQQETALTQYKQKYMGELPAQQEMNQSILDRLSRDLRVNVEALERVRERRSAIVGQLALVGSYDAIPSALDSYTQTEPANGVSGVGEALQAQLAKSQQLLADLRREYSDAYPDVKRLKREIADLETEIAAHQTSTSVQQTARVPESQNQRTTSDVSRSIDKRAIKHGGLKGLLAIQIAKIDAEMQKLLKEQVSMRQKIAEYERRITSAFQREQELILLRRDYDSTKANYDSLSQRHMQAKLAENLEKRQKGEQFKILDPAPLPLKPWKPQRKVVTTIGLLVGLCLGGVFVFTLEFFDSSFREPEELERVLKLPVLATIPLQTMAVEHSPQHLWHRWMYVAYIFVPVVVGGLTLYMYWAQVVPFLARIIERLHL